MTKTFVLRAAVSVHPQIEIQTLLDVLDRIREHMAVKTAAEHTR